MTNTPVPELTLFIRYRAQQITKIILKNKKMKNQTEKLKELEEKIAELDKKVNQIQRSTATKINTFLPFHNQLRMKSKLYYRWHLNPKASLTHLVVLISYIVIIVISSTYFTMSLYKSTKAAGNTYYVATNGSDSNPGTEVQPFSTIQRGIGAVSTGDTILVRGGVYNENPDINNKTNIILKNYPGETPIVRGDSETHRYGIITIESSASYITLDGFTIDEEMIPVRYDGGYINGVQIWGSYNTIKNMTIKGSSERVNPPTYDNFYPEDTDTVGTAITMANGASHNVIEGNTITDIHRRGTSDRLGGTYRGFGIISGNNSHYNTIRSNIVLRVHNASIYIGASGASQQSDVQHDTIIENNTLGESVQEDGIHFDAGYHPDWPIHDIIIRNNHIYSHPENGIDLKGTENIEIYGNIIHGCPGNDDAGLWDDAGNNFLGGVGGIMHGSGTMSKNVSIYNNIIYDNNGGILVENGYKIFNNVIYGNNKIYSGSNNTYDWTRKPLFSGIKMINGPMEVGGNYTDIVIKNNIIGGHRHGEIALKGSIAGNTDINNNLYSDYIDPVTEQNMGTRLVKFTDKYDWDYTDFAGWETYLQGLTSVIGNDASSFTADPKFVDSAGFDFHLQQTSPAINAGTQDGASTTDIEGNPRVGAVDIGAYEYQEDGGEENVSKITTVKNEQRDYNFYVYNSPEGSQACDIQDSDMWNIPDGNNVIAQAYLDGDKIGVIKNEQGDFNFYLYNAPQGQEAAIQIGADYWNIPGGNNIVSIAGLDSDGDSEDELAVLKNENGDHNLYIYELPSGDEAKSKIASDLWNIPFGNNVISICGINIQDSGTDKIAVLKNESGDHNLYIYDAPTSDQACTKIASDLWNIPDGNNVISIAGIDYSGNGRKDKIAVLKNNNGDYDLYVYNLPSTLLTPASSYGQDLWNIPGGNNIVDLGG